MRRRRFYVVLAVVAIAAALVVVVALRHAAPPEAARLLPEADGVLYVDLRLVRLFGQMTELPDVTQEREYEEFVRQTGIQVERDLAEAAIAMHAPEAAPAVKGGKPAPAVLEPRFSQILVGKFNSEKLAAYLSKLARNKEQYRDREIFHIPSEERTVRVCILGADTVAVSNTASAREMHGMVDRYRAKASPASGSALVAEHYARIPVGSLAWAMARSEEAPGGLEWLPLRIALPGEVTWVASARYTGALHLRLEAIAASAADAKQLSEQARTLLGLYRSVEGSVPQAAADADVKAFVDSLEVQQEENRTLVTGTLTQGFIEKALAQPPAAAAPVEEVPAGGKGAAPKK